MSVFFSGLMAPLDKNNVDTDQIIPKQFLTSTSRDGFDAALFYDWRYLDNGEPNPEFILNRPCYQGAQILLTRDNFGCGSSREHAPWALKQYGFEVILAESFADIFFNNCGNNQMLAIALPAETLEQLFVLSEQYDDIHIEVDLENQQLRSDKFETIHFDIRHDIKERLLSGLDFIGVTETLNGQIDAFEKQLAATRPWQ
ncbi:MULTISPECIES: 3-isopropylmalate dehydratase small subunit [Pseudoalteromonas]|jgi:3-isopropylmalate/(R)-2-methylmalate dehydratase small subunit|uniref:3-isopropylmalate dehydratase small subunit n=1 Tax=Pseudoalteromonas lipolytica TaxID=570156 RepID=A0AAD0S322_9GAMM|nr:MULTISPECIES: 3-isopropylmalate dehydratase small subunit [Pseudoalteromonas]AXV66629.1 3-isopropylmalate dehydratase small subunit [Pseudoalteromonas donghaensis]EWH04757.1 3-isopropylmalate dehydratase [Pseudoalteromonas lipolytica SCSIO 04301]MCC9661691.1 3-isopropylmalate dehydratase small subunit [Pseudoalteromonas sp. MB41]QLJ08154.1 3-isopropylmalate dehydratase small subunit [Pseudoalteromonas sp. JSTW]QMW14386.1 3-isopropylmalate dehydratase small subunit [Pseudoalteromonas sp. MT3|tara:strand:- start:1460 stop:2059 length:600 start_codon:yes stop_codon:yes gene_type:complete